MILGNVFQSIFFHDWSAHDGNASHGWVEPYTHKKMVGGVLISLHVSKTKRMFPDFWMNDNILKSHTCISVTGIHVCQCIPRLTSKTYFR